MLERPWMTALEMQFAAIRLSGHVRAHLKATLQTDDAKTFLHQLEDGEGILRMADAFAWASQPIQAVAEAAQTIPEDTQLKDFSAFPGPTCWWWWFEHPLPFEMAEPGAPEDTRTIHGLLLAHGHRPKQPIGSLIMIGFGKLESSNEPFMYPTAWRWDLDETIAQTVTRNVARGIDADGQGLRSMSRFVAAALIWLQQRILVESRGPVERHRRKQLAREHDAPLPSDVRVIELRRPEPSPDGDHGAVALIEWSCRWIVSGHWRNQPVKDGRKLIYILPYVKGPADQPLRVPTHTVYEVRR